MNYTTMKEVTKDEFFGIINEGKLDVLVRPETKEPGHWYPHTTEFKFRDGTVFGKIVEDFHDGSTIPWSRNTTLTSNDSHEIIRRTTNLRCGIRDGFAER